MTGTVIAVDTSSGVFWEFDERDQNEHTLKVIACTEESPFFKSYEQKKDSPENHLVYSGNVPIECTSREIEDGDKENEYDGEDFGTYDSSNDSCDG